ncbi:MAG: hypothetical protein JW797_15475 [Bradymonadales bacterium]|nr:hypothetical protein [Bradymonadales bacterium]
MNTARSKSPAARSKPPVHRLVPIWTLLLIALIALPVGCGPSQTYVQAVSAESSGDWHNAVVNYRATLVEDPNNTQARVRLIQAEQQLAQVTASRVNELLQRDDVAGAIQVIQPEVALLPDDPTLAYSLESIRLQGVARLSSLLASGHHRQAFEEAMTFQRAFPRDAETNTLRIRARAGFAERIRARAIAAEQENRPGMALVSWIEHRDLFDDRESHARSAELRQALEEELTFPFTVQHFGLLADRAIPRLPAGLLASPVTPDQARVSVLASLEEPDLEESYTTRIAYQTYLQGYETLPNPAYSSVLWNVEQAERDVLYRERQVLQAEEEAHRAEVELNRHRDQDDRDSYFGRWDYATRNLQNERGRLLRERERLQYARERLRDTPPTVVQEVWADFPYEIREYTLTATARFDAQVQPTDQPPLSLVEQLTTRTHDQTHDGFPHVGLAHDPLQYPYNPRTLTELLKDRAVQTVQTIVRQQYDAYRQQFLAAGLALVDSDPDAAVEQLVRYVLLDPSRVAPEAATWLDRLADLWDCGLFLETP